MGLFSSIGKIFNDVTGATSSAKLNNKYQKEFAQNAHQWEVEDLKKAGLNPVLSAGGSGASASGGGSGNQAGTIGGISEIINSASGLLKLSSEIDNIDQDTELKGALTGKTPHEIKEIQSRTNRNIEETKEVSSKIMVNTATALERRMNAEYQKRRASGKGVNLQTKWGSIGGNW